MTTPATITIAGDTVSRTVAGETATTSALGFARHLGRHVPVDTGLLPPGVRWFRQAAHRHQFVLEMEPGINHVCWGEYEGGAAEWYVLAQPWVYGLAEFANNNFVGARMFYSPTRISTPSDPLYAVPLPNLNWRGYGGTGVGWVCLYHTQNTTKMNLAEQALYVLHRLSGMEAYNNANMRGTDGPRYYQAEGKPRYTYDPKAWEKKTETEGGAWVFEPGLWIPVTVAGIDDQSCITKGGVPLTLEMAITGNTKFYYSDTLPKPFNVLHRDLDASTLHTEIFDPAFVGAAADRPPKVAKVAKVAKPTPAATKVARTRKMT